MSRRLLILLSVLALAVAALSPVAAGAEEIPDVSGLSVPDSALSAIQDSKIQTYIVQMLDDPVVAYEGDIKGYPATKPTNGKKIDPNSGKVDKYAGYLKNGHDAALSRSGGSKLYDYVYVYNGFAAELSGAQARDLMSDPAVLAVTPDEVMQVDTVSTSDFLSLDEAGGIWEVTGTSTDAGEGVIVGIIDTGIWPENPSFSDRTGTNSNGKDGKLDYHQIPGWHGKCTPGDEFTASDCNQKVIGAQWFNEGWGGDDGVRALWDFEYASARDWGGHGSHTASTAAGNYGVPVVVDGVDLGEATGMAPRARIAMYKVCWADAPTGGGCTTSDSVAAIDQAVADGVDVLNYSISGSRTNYLDPVEVAFLFAADAGIFVAASAGNEGPNTVAHMSPWLTTVAAGTHDRYYEGTATVDGVVYTGAMAAEGPVTGELIYAGDAGDPLCNIGSLDPSLVDGKIVLCDRGEIARVDKSFEVASAGGIGMIHANTAQNSVNADLHYVPTVHLDHVDGAAARLQAQAGGLTATLAGGNLVTAEAPNVAAFSSTGPNLAGGDLLKPDIMAPGVDVIAAVAPPGNRGRDFDAYSGTSMSSPHIAGIGALMVDAHPDWSPAMIKSALMTTASQETNMGYPIPGTPFEYGAGHVVPNAATDPGLVYDAGWVDWLGFLCGTGQLTASYCPSIGIDPSDLNYPSISIADLAGFQTVTRTVTNVGAAGTYDVSVEEPTGIDVEVSPTQLTLAAGESASYEVTFTSTGAAALGSYAFGSLTWSDGTHSVRSPLTVKPEQLSAPAEMHGAGDAGSMSYSVTFGYAGTFDASVQGLVPAVVVAGNVVDDPANDINTALATGVGITVHFVPVPVGSEYARFSLFDEYTDGDDDLDLYVFDAGFGFVGSSGSGTSNEEVNIVGPASSGYYAIVHGWQTDGPDSNYDLFSWSFRDVDAGNATLTMVPASATLGATETIQLDWTGLTAGTKYLGAVVYNDGADFGSTVIRVDTD